MPEPQATPADAKLYGRLLVYVKPYWLTFVVSALALTLFSAMSAAFLDLFNLLMSYIGNVSEQQAAKSLQESAGVLGGLVNMPGAEVAGDSIIVRLCEWLGVDLSARIGEQGRVLLPLFFMAVALIRGLGFFVGNYGMAYISSYLVHNLRTDIFNKMTRLPTAYFDHNMSGHLISRLTYHVTQVTEALTTAVKTIITEGSMVLLLVAMLFYYGGQLAVILLVVLPVIAVVVRLVGKRFRKISLRIQSAQGEVTQVSQELINGLRVMRGFGGEAYERGRMDSASHSNRRQVVKMGIVEGLSSPVIQLIISAMMALLIYFALGPEFVGEITLNNLVMFLLIAGMLTRPVRKLTSVMGPIQKGLAAAQSLFQTLDTDEEQDTGTVELAQVQGRFEFENLSFSYSQSSGSVLNDISFQVAPGEQIALVGSSGSGKSTLVNLIPRFYNYNSGAIRLDGVDINDISLENLRSQISFVNQQVTLFNDTVYNNIAYGKLADSPREKVVEACRAAHALGFIETLPNGFDTLIGDNGSTLSGGQCQRLVIARALLKEAPILILDEATSALDPESEHHIQAALQQLMRGRTTFVIAHRLSTVENADRILVMEQGQLVEQGSHRELLAANGRYANLYRKGFEESQ